MITLPQVMQGVNIFVDGNSKLGVATMFMPPVIEEDMEEIKPGGMDVPIEHSKGMKVMAGSFELGRYDEDVLSRFGIGTRQRITFRTSVETLGDAQDAIPVMGEIEGTFKKVDLGEYGESKKVGIKFDYTAQYYKLDVGTLNIYEIDGPNVKRVIRGVDQLEKRRENLGI